MLEQSETEQHKLPTINWNDHLKKTEIAVWFPPSESILTYFKTVDIGLEHLHHSGHMHIAYESRKETSHLAVHHLVTNTKSNDINWKTKMNYFGKDCKWRYANSKICRQENSLYFTNISSIIEMLKQMKSMGVSDSAKFLQIQLI